MSFVVPLLIASILGWLDSKASAAKPATKIPLLFVDQDHSMVSARIWTRLGRSEMVVPEAIDLEQAKARVSIGESAVAVVFPPNFGTQASAAFTGGDKPSVSFLTDPSKPTESEIAKGAVLSEASGAVATEAFGALAGDGSAPLKVVDSPMAAKSVPWSRAAHDYAGFGLQGLLFFAIESAISLARERRLGIWRRLRSAPISGNVILASRFISSTVLALGIVLSLFGVGTLLFGIKILGSGSAFVLLAITTAMMTASFGLMVTTMGKTESQTRGLSVLLILVMLATGGAWFPLQQMPEAVQTAARFLPVRWAIEGFDAVTWRGMNLDFTMRYVGALCCFTVVFALIASVRFGIVAKQS